jgi:DNA replication protein DnaC
LSDLDSTELAQKNKAKDYLHKNSVVSNKSVFKRTFGTYKATERHEKEALAFSRKMADKLTDGQIVHASLIGSTGTGKTHLAMGIVYNVLARTHYRKKVGFIDWREYLNLLKVGMHDNSKDVQTYTDFLRRQLTAADILVLDDIGAERGTEFDISEADTFWRLREDKSVIMTTNLSIAELKEHYGQRTISRMQPHNDGATFVMAGIADHRAN